VKAHITLKQIAQELNISVMTVSRALNNHPNVNKKTREKVLKAAKRLGYIPNFIAKSLVKKKTYTIGVVVPEITYSFFPEAIKGIEEIASSHGYQLILAYSAEDAQKEKSALLTLASKRVDGILISIAETSNDYSIYKQILSLGIPVVFFDRCVYNIGASCVSIDDENASEMLTEHLILHGYKRLAHLSGTLSVSIGKLRLKGFKKALKKYGLEINSDLIVETGFKEEEGYEAMNKILNLPEEKLPRAIVAVNDPVAYGAIKAIEEKGLKIPNDIAIVGFSDDIRANLIPTPLTTVKQHAYELGKVAATKLFNHIENKNEKIERKIVKSELIIRKSCGC